MPAFRNVRRSRRISKQPPRDPSNDEYDLFDLNLLYPDTDNTEPASSSASPSSNAPSPASASNSAELDIGVDLSSSLLSPALLFSGGARTSHSRKKKEGHIPRPPNAFMIFRSELWRKEKIKRTVERDHRNISRIAGSLWNRLSTTDQVPYRRAAEEAKRIHAQLYPNYKYAPVYHRDRRAQPKAKADHKKKAQRCDKVAQLLHRGIVGDELEKELGKRKAGKVDGYASDESEYVDAPPRKKSRKSSKASTKKSSSAQRPNRARVVQAQPEEPTSPAVVADAQEDCVVDALAYPSASPSPRASNSSECASTTPDMGAFVPTSEIPDICIGEPQVMFTDPFAPGMPPSSHHLDAHYSPLDPLSPASDSLSDSLSDYFLGSSHTEYHHSDPALLSPDDLLLGHYTIQPEVSLMVTGGFQSAVDCFESVSSHNDYFMDYTEPDFEDFMKFDVEDCA